MEGNDEGGFEETKEAIKVDLLSSGKLYFEEEGMCEGKERVILRMGRAEWYGQG